MDHLHEVQQREAGDDDVDGCIPEERGKQRDMRDTRRQCRRAHHRQDGHETTIRGKFPLLQAWRSGAGIDTMTRTRRFERHMGMSVGATSDGRKDDEEKVWRACKAHEGREK